MIMKYQCRNVVSSFHHVNAVGLLSMEKLHVKRTSARRKTCILYTICLKQTRVNIQGHRDFWDYPQCCCCLSQMTSASFVANNWETMWLNTSTTESVQVTSWWLKSPATRLFNGLFILKYEKAPQYCPLWGESTGEFPRKGPVIVKTFACHYAILSITTYNNLIYVFYCGLDTINLRILYVLKSYVNMSKFT